MAVAIKVPELGDQTEDVRLIAWVVDEGQSVKSGDVIAEIETDKAAVELESEAGGVLLKQAASVGQTLKTGQVIAFVGEPGESVPEPEEEESEPPPQAGASVSQPQAGQDTGRVRATPAARSLARKLGVDLAQVRGTGKDGAISRDDITAAAGPAEAPAGRKLTTMQSAVAKAVSNSWREKPHIWLTAAIDMSAADEFRKQCKDAGGRVSYDAIFLKAMAGAIETEPIMSARLEGEQVISSNGVNVALTVGMEENLFMLVVRDADGRDIRSIQNEIDDLVSHAKSDRLKAEHMTGAYISLSNLGRYPIESFDAIIYPEHSAVLAVGAVTEQPVAIDGGVEVRPIARVSLATDHRLINGIQAAKFLSMVKETIESGTIFQ